MAETKEAMDTSDTKDQGNHISGINDQCSKSITLDIPVIAIVIQVLQYLYIDGHESKPAISIFRIFIIFS